MQKWTGTFVWNDQCKPNYCCCYADKLTVTASGSNLLFTSGTKGCPTSTSSSTFSNPNGYSFSTIGARGAQITYTLSSDSNTITAKNNGYSFCEGSARRTSTGTGVYPSIILFIILFATIQCVL
ncbi:unnamed protein product [Rotaria sp. Silwood1]|nr:unnamed protein product [Rotaria sp. Silwood1]CAF1031611.1 unnamed protein product [Rotaria sp. Silwood1]CAF1039349.1 unnamed protein product [Rotaria sp. Silwood1]CAF3390666.1 unnamed protein product [Rotaria sp. Silwood1]CAF3424361.1 unnamed protein product [Rotaria sp. Silwood1]